MNFTKWYENADMPTRTDDGRWVDLETGLLYAPAKPRATLSSAAQDARAVAKTFGGKALVGTARQKEWAEKIRAEKLAQMSVEQAELVCDPKNILQNAKFWIENRAESAEGIATFEITRRALLKQARALKAANDAAGYAAKAAEYNALTTQWGWK